MEEVSSLIDEQPFIAYIFIKVLYYTIFRYRSHYIVTNYLEMEKKYLAILLSVIGLLMACVALVALLLRHQANRVPPESIIARIGSIERIGVHRKWFARILIYRTLKQLYVGSRS